MSAVGLIDRRIVAVVMVRYSAFANALKTSRIALLAPSIIARRAGRSWLAARPRSSFLLGHDSMDGVGRATQESKPKKDGTRKKANPDAWPAYGGCPPPPRMEAVGRRTTPKPSASHHIGVAAIDILVVRRSTRHPWRYDPDMAAMLGHAEGSEDQEQEQERAGQHWVSLSYIVLNLCEFSLLGITNNFRVD